LKLGVGKSTSSFEKLEKTKTVTEIGGKKKNKTRHGRGGKKSSCDEKIKQGWYDTRGATLKKNPKGKKPSTRLFVGVRGKKRRHKKQKPNASRKKREHEYSRGGK